MGYPLAVLYKYFDDQGPFLAALITYYGFVSLFPLLLLLSTLLGFVLAGDPQLRTQVMASALAEFPVIGSQLSEPRGLGGGTGGIVIGILGALYGGIGVAQAIQHAMNTAWSIPRNSRPDAVKSRVRSLLLLGTVGLALIGTTVLSAFGGYADALGLAGRVLFLALSVAVNAGAFILAFRIGTVRPLTVRQVLPGAVGAAVAWQLLQSVGPIYVAQVVRRASAMNGVFAVVLGLLAFLYVAAVAIVLCVEANVVRVDRLHPRALLTPFTDQVDLTAGDRKSYARQAKAQRLKGFERIDVTFDERRQGSSDSDGSDHEGPQPSETP
ncbi:YihY/virulence factor BrkB family protein [Sinomonas susongensis]|uniref:YihY/virulence factor BrkB family protein n=1 Tax=Sinomonas susongensis TaxID=1324851 RepID=UPI001FE8F647|nr:YihY/virulence factor BrkB family protein [Sinomonas susongensis]